VRGEHRIKWPIEKKALEHSAGKQRYEEGLEQTALYRLRPAGLWAIWHWICIVRGEVIKPARRL